MKTLLCISISAFTLFVVDTWDKQHLNAQRATFSANDLPVVTGVANDNKTPKIWAQKAPLYKGETLELHFTGSNAPYLGVVDPEGHFFYVVYPGEPVAGDLSPLVESKYFINLRTLNINTSLFKADPYVYDVYTNQPVFTKSGSYTFILGEDLHVDDPALLDKVVIHYIHSYKPVQTSNGSLKTPSKDNARQTQFYKRA